MFYNVDYYQAFLQCLDEVNKRFAAEIQAYCLMSNHYHLLIKTPRANRITGLGLLFMIKLF